ncbi:hypothetical protein [Streptomyces sp. TE33382]
MPSTSSPTHADQDLKARTARAHSKAGEPPPARRQADAYAKADVPATLNYSYLLLG